MEAGQRQLDGLLPLPARRLNSAVASTVACCTASVTLPAGAAWTMVSKRSTASVLAAAGSAIGRAPRASNVAGPVQATSLASCWVFTCEVVTVMPGSAKLAFRSAPSTVLCWPLRIASGKLARSAWLKTG